MKTTPTLFAILLSFLAFHGVAAESTNNAADDLMRGWKEMAFKYQVQHPYDLELKERYKFDATNNIHDFWVYFSDKPHAPPPNTTTARTEMRLESFTNGEHMFSGDVNIRPGTFACIAQVFDEAHGPVTMVIAHPDGTVTIGRDT